MLPLSKPISSIRAHYDAVVVGSGYGGGVAASRLARAGKRVCVLERGREYLTGQFPGKLSELRNEVMLSDGAGKPGLYDVRMGEHLHVLVGCGLGGGSLVNAGVALRPDARVFADAAWPAEISGGLDLIDEGYARATYWLRPAADPRAREMTKFGALDRASSVLRQPADPARVVVSFEANINPAGIEQPACTRCGDCCGGCNVGAKNTVAQTYLPDAVNHGAEIFCQARVDHLARHGTTGWRLFWRPSGDVKGPLAEVTADIVVLAAGSLGSTEILLRSRDHGLALSDRLGHGFSANGDIIAFGYNAKERVNAVGVGHPPRSQVPPVGASVSGQIIIDDPDDLEQGMIVQEGVLPSAIGPLLPVFFVPGGRLLGAAHALLKGVYDGPLARTHTFFVVSHDDARGRIVLKDGKATVAWPDVMQHPVYARVDSTLDALCKANGATYVKNPMSETIMGRKPATAHPLGGCGMGADATLGTVNHKGQAFVGGDGKTLRTHEGLYVVDGSVIPRSLGCNPLFTITALAERSLQLMMSDYQLRSLEGA
jgi:cholesterol oxidase